MPFSSSSQRNRSPARSARILQPPQSDILFHRGRRRVIKGALALGSLLALGTGGYLAAHWYGLFLPPLTTTDIGTIRALAWSPDGTYIALAKGPETQTVYDLTHIEVGTPGVQIWDAACGRVCVSYPTATDVMSLSWSPDSQWLASSVGDLVQIWARPSTEGRDGGRPVIKLAEAGQSTADAIGGMVAWSPDGRRLASGKFNGELAVWDMHRKEVFWQITRPGDWCSALSWSPNSQHIALSTMLTYPRRPGWLGIVDANTGQVLLDLEYADDTDAQGNVSLMWSPDGRFIAVGHPRTGDGSKGKVSILDARTGKQIKAYFVKGRKDDPETPWVQAVAWSPDSRRIASTGYTYTIHMWDVMTDALVITYPPGPGVGTHASPTAPLAWSPNGKHLASATDAVYVGIWDVP
ncbi:MAG: WD40 repeat domain-containing protein [Chloroflexota bacterium]|nr:WD40 repeat domain-containing protein [Chloroflexota bacterium]